MFQNLCGKKAMENVFLTTTQWSNVDRAEGEAREDNLRYGGLWGGLIRKGATLQRFHGTRESGFELIHRLMPNMPKPLDIQDQIVKQNMTLLETDAGKCVCEELIAQEKKFKEQLDSLEKRLQDVMSAMGRGMENLMEEHAKARQKLREAVAGIELLIELHIAEVKKPKAREREEEAKTNTQKPPDIRDQIVENRTALLESNFGKSLNNRLIAHENPLKEQLESLEKKLQEVMGGMGHEVKTVMEEQAKTQNKLERLQLRRKTLCRISCDGDMRTGSGGEGEVRNTGQEW